MIDVYVLLGFGVFGYLMKAGNIPVLPFVIAYILATPLERTVRNAFEASGSNPYFLFDGLVAPAFLIMAVGVVLASGWLRKA